MNSRRSAFFLAGALGLASRSVFAFGGGFFPAGSGTAVTGHSVIVSVSSTQTTLWDEMTYTGAPQSFAWVLPIKGPVTLGISSDALFSTLEGSTGLAPRPPASCANTTCGGVDSGTGSGTDSGNSSGMDGNGMLDSSTGTGLVAVLARASVGPYETVQLSSSAPSALSEWLTQHGYEIPTAVSPILSAYVSEGFNFLAIKLVPGAGVNRMRPLRVTTPGALAALPLRMTAAGTGSRVPIDLYVLASGRYEPTNLPVFSISPGALVWDWDTATSNLTALAQMGFAASQNKGWLVEQAGPYTTSALSAALAGLVQSDPIGSGYADSSGSGAPRALNEDLNALAGSLGSAPWLTVLHAELSREALSADLVLGLAASQTELPREPAIQQTTGTAPACPVCDASVPFDAGAPDAGALPEDAAIPMDTATTTTRDAGSSMPVSRGCACATHTPRGPLRSGVAAVLGAALLALGRRRPRRIERAIG